MRVDSKLLHPSVSKAVSSVVWSGGVGQDPKTMAAYQSQWFKEQGVGALLILLAATVLFGLSIVGVRALEVDRTARAIIVLALALLFGILLIVGALRQARSLSVAQLEALVPSLDLSETQRAYVETMVALHRSGRPNAEAGETLAALNRLLDEESRLLEIRSSLTGQDSSDALDRLNAERVALVAKLKGTNDPGAREAYVQSLALLDERIAGLSTVGAGLERIEAHLELLRQAVLATRDAARRVSTAPQAVPDLATDSLRAAVALARAQTTETERALAELRSI